MKVPQRLVILDTHAILHRAYHALPELSSSKGEPTGALYGLISMLIRIIADLKPDYIVAAFDLPKPTHRHIAFDGYKAQRPKAEDALVRQIIRSRDVLDALNIPRYECEGFEADDIIATIVQKLAHSSDIEIIIASGDMDTMQLVDGERVRVFTLKKGLSETVLYDEKGVRARYGFAPEHIADYKGLRGDPSDNIPGVKGVGEKTASALIAMFGTIDELYRTLQREPEKVAAAGVKPAMLEKLRTQEEEARFSKALAELRYDAPVDFSLPSKPWSEGIESSSALNMLAEFEFRTLVSRLKEILGKNIAETQPHQGALDVPVDQKTFEEAALGVWVLDSNITQPTLDDVYRIGGAHDINEALAHIRQRIEEEHLSYVYKEIELPLAPVLRAMEERGVLLDRAFLGELSVTYHKELETIAARIYGAAGEVFNINSPKQLGEVLFDKLGLSAKNQKKTAGGARSTRESELHKLREGNPIVDDVLAYRELQKLLSTYIDTLPTLLDAHDRLHTSFVQTGTTTGRLASQNPNLQNIPIKTELGRAIRHAFIASPGTRLVTFDYSQIELRIAAFLSEDPGLIDIFKNGRDVHAEVAARVFHVPSEQVSYEHRRRAKVINFGILYGMGVNSLREALGTNRAEAQAFYNDYFAAFPRLAQYIDEVKAHAARVGYTETFFGRRRYFEGINSTIPFVRSAAERMAINAPMQGTQSDIVKLAMIRISGWIKEHHLQDRIHLVLQVHDELMFEIEESTVALCAKEIKHIMENVIPKEQCKEIPFIAESKIGPHWGDMESL